MRERIEKMIAIGWALTILAIIGYVIFEVIFVDIQRYWPIIFICVLIIIIFTDKNKDYQWLKKNLSSYKKGDAGETIVLERLKSVFDDNYLYIMNYSNPGIIWGDIDGILLGPRGIFLLEVKNWQGYFSLFGINIYKRTSHDLYTPLKSPIEQLGVNKEKLTQYLENKGLSIIPLPFVVLVNGKVEQFIGKTQIYITDPEKITGKILTSTNHDFSKELINKILLALEIF